jgi:hypothetical protein
MPRSRSASTRQERALAISPISSSSSNTVQNSQDSGWQQFMQMAQAINAGDSDAAQQAYTDFTQSPAAKVVVANPDSPLAQALNQIGQSLQSGDLSGAQQALQSARPHGHHHHGGGAQQTATPQIGANSNDPNAPGSNVNLTA